MRKGVLVALCAYQNPEQFWVADTVLRVARQRLAPSIDVVISYQPARRKHELFAEKLRLLNALCRLEGYEFYGMLDSDVIVRDDGAKALWEVFDAHPQAWIFAMDEAIWGGYVYLPFRTYLKRLNFTFNRNAIDVRAVKCYPNAGLIVLRHPFAQEVLRWWNWFLQNGLNADPFLEQHALAAAIHFLNWHDRYVSLTPYPCQFARSQPEEAPFVHLFASTQFHRLKEWAIRQVNASPTDEKAS